MSTDIRFNVERPLGYRDAGGMFEDVGAEGGFEIETSGTLLFRDGEGNVILAYAPHAWSTVTPA